MKPFHVIKDGIVYEFQPEPQGDYTVTVPSLPGYISHGRSFEAAMSLIEDAMQGSPAVVGEKGLPFAEQLQESRIGPPPGGPALAQRMDELRNEIGPIGIATSDLIREGRRR